MGKILPSLIALTAALFLSNCDQAKSTKEKNLQDNGERTKEKLYSPFTYAEVKEIKR